MTLRVRLVSALGVMLVFGLAIFGFGTYSAYSRSQYQRLDDQLRSSVGPVSGDLAQASGILGRLNDPTPPGVDDPGRLQPGFAVPLGTYGELRNSSGKIQISKSFQTATATNVPHLSSSLTTSGQAFTVDSDKGSGKWRVLVASSPGPSGGQIVVAVPTSSVSDSLQRLIIVETVAGLALLVLLTAGSWLILRRGLRPLENMAHSASTINAGDLSQRVSPADNKSEVGQLGLALNTMLGEIQEAFHERDATEHRLRQFLADASHELRTPLTSIQGFAELFRLGAVNEHIDQAIIVRRIEEESARMKTLVEDLLLLARLDETRSTVREAVDLSVLAADACSDAAATDHSRPITLDAPEPVVIAGDRDHLRQAVANLVSNVLSHTPEGSAIEVGAHLMNGHAVISVRDHGPGLEPDALAHVFDRFWQADQARVGSGVGLGLAIVAGIAVEHGGHATASNHPNGGAVFMLRLPIYT